MGQSGSSDDWYRSINTWHKHGRNRVSISFDGHRGTQKDEAELRSGTDGESLIARVPAHACGGFVAGFAPAAARLAARLSAEASSQRATKG